MTHSSALERFADLVRDPSRLDERQLDGLACVWCAREHSAMVPIGIINHAQVFACEDGLACAAAAEQLPGGYAGGETERWDF